MPMTLPSMPKIAVLADMLELGEKSYEGHYDCGAFCAENGVDMVIAVGEEAAATADAALARGKN